MVDFQEFSNQLRKPTGEGAKQVTDFMAKANIQLYDFVMSRLKFFPGMKIIELGMADGFFVKKFYERENEISYFGVDYSTDMVHEAQNVNSEFAKERDIIFQVGNISSLEFDTDSFDAFVTINTHYFWDNLAEGINEMIRVIKPNGQFLICGRTMESMKLLPFTQFGFAYYSDETLQHLFNIPTVTDFNFDTFKEKIKLPTDEETVLVNFCAFGIKV